MDSRLRGNDKTFIGHTQMKPIYIHSGMAGAPQYANADGNINGILEACLVNGFNSRTATSASASGGVLTLNFASDPGFEALQTVEVAVSSVALVNGQHRVVANSNNQVTIAIPGLPDGAVGSSGAGITIKQAAAGWSKPYSNTTTAVFRPPAGNRRYLRCVHVVDEFVAVRAFTAMTSVDAGDNPFPTVAQASALLAVYNVYANAGAAWFVVATDKWFVFTLGSIFSGSAINYGTGYLFFGELLENLLASDVHNTCLIGAQGGYMLSHDGALNSLPVYLSAETTMSWSLENQEYTKFIPYVKIIQNSNNLMRGILPNVYKISVESQNSNFEKVYENVLGIDGRIKPIIRYSMEAANIAIACDEDVWL